CPGRSRAAAPTVVRPRPAAPPSSPRGPHVPAHRPRRNAATRAAAPARPAAARHPPPGRPPAPTRRGCPPGAPRSPSTGRPRWAWSSLLLLPHTAAVQLAQHAEAGDAGLGAGAVRVAERRPARQRRPAPVSAADAVRLCLGAERVGDRLLREGAEVVGAPLV